MTTLITGTIPPPKQLRFVNNQGQPPSKRPRINAACLTCRRRKTRCAGEKPSCSTCTKNGHHCLGYGDLIEKPREPGRRTARINSERSDTSDQSRRDDDFLDNAGDESDERRHSKSTNSSRSTSRPRPAATQRRDSVSSSATSGGPRGHSNDWDQESNSQSAGKPARKTGFPRRPSYSKESRNANSRSPMQQHTESHKVPYFRYFGSTAIVPGYKQMLVNVSVNRDRRKSRGSSFSGTSPGALFGHGLAGTYLSQEDSALENLEDMPVYDDSDPAPTHPLIFSLVKTFFLHLGCNYPFLREEKCLRMLQEKSMEPILVDSMCALAARFSDLPAFTNVGGGKRSEYGHVFAQRAKAATIDTFPCPSVSAVQACLLMAYEGFGANQDSALWMYLGLAIRMAVDVGLQRKEGIMYRGGRDPWYTRTWSLKTNEGLHENVPSNEDLALGIEEQRELEQERLDTFWSVFILDRVISSGTGRPVTFRDDDFELALPDPVDDPVSGWPAPFPVFIQIIHLYGRVSDILNKLRDANDLTQSVMSKLAQMEHELTKMYQRQDPRLNFSVQNFQEYVKVGQGPTFILMHFWFHALIIILHQPLMPFGSMSRMQLLPNSRELSMSSAKTIADILAFAELIDPKSFIGNPFTSQPMYIAACAFLMESAANASEPASREVSPPPEHKTEGGGKPPMSKPASTKHSLLASAANQNYQRCYKSLQQLEAYWGGVGYILTALDQRSKGIWDCETFTNEEYERTKIPRRGSLTRLARFDNPASPNAQPVAFSITGTTNSPNPSVTLMYQNAPSIMHQQAPTSVPASAATPPGNMIYDPIRQSLPEAPAMFPPMYPQAPVSALRYSSLSPKATRLSNSSILSPHMASRSPRKYASEDANPNSPSNESSKLHVLTSHGLPPPSYTPSSQQSSAYDASMVHSGESPASTLTESGPHHHSSNGHSSNSNINGGNNGHGRQAEFAQAGLTSGSYSYLGLGPISDVITFDSQDIDIGTLGLSNEMMQPWLEYLPGDVLGLFPSGAGMSNGGQDQMD